MKLSFGKWIEYGVAYTGMGQYGFYKLELQFGCPMKFVTNELQQYGQPTSAALMDATLGFLTLS